VSIDEFRNFLQLIDFKLKDEEPKERMDEICNWASYRGQTLTSTGKMSSAIM
jgi:callose synthase